MEGSIPFIYIYTRQCFIHGGVYTIYIYILGSVSYMEGSIPFIYILGSVSYMRGLYHLYIYIYILKIALKNAHLSHPSSTH